MQRGDEGGWGLLILFCVLVFFMAMPYYVGWSSRDEQSRLAGLLVQKKTRVSVDVCFCISKLRHINRGRSVKSSVVVTNLINERRERRRKRHVMGKQHDLWLFLKTILPGNGTHT